MPDHGTPAEPANAGPEQGSGPGVMQVSPEISQPASGTTVPYAKVTDPSYKEFSDTCTAVESKTGVRLTGQCRRCGHAMSYPWPKKVIGRNIFGSLFSSRTIISATGTQLRMTCLCSETHSGRPEGGHGCGAYWNVVVYEGSDA